VLATARAGSCGASHGAKQAIKKRLITISAPTASIAFPGLIA
jgi:hypothetical protein